MNKRWNKKRYLILPLFIILIISLIIILYLGFYGISNEKCIKKENCESCYREYTIPSFITENYSCRTLQSPCINSNENEYIKKWIKVNQQVNLIKCLCNGEMRNNKIITDTFKELINSNLSSGLNYLFFHDNSSYYYFRYNKDIIINNLSNDYQIICSIQMGGTD